MILINYARIQNFVENAHKYDFNLDLNFLYEHHFVTRWHINPADDLSRLYINAEFQPNQHKSEFY